MPGNFRSGAPRVPTAIHALRGTRARYRPREPRYPPAIPDPPEDLLLDEHAVAAWNDLIGDLGPMRVLSKANKQALAIVARALGDLKRTRAALHQMSYQQLVVEEVRDRVTGNVVRRRVRPNPLIAQATKQAELCRKLLGEFGLTPVTSARVEVPDAPAPRSVASRYISGSA